MDSLLRHMLADEALSSALQSCRTLDEFVDLAHASDAARARAMSREAFRRALVGANRTAGPRSDTPPPGDGWLPAEVSWTNGEPSVRWRWVGRQRLKEPFFSDTIRRARERPYSELVSMTTSMGALDQYVAGRPGLPLIGLIAHVSRCGSTLASQMLASLPSLVVASEPPPFDSVLREGPSHLDRAVRVQWLRSMAAAIGQPREGGERAFIIKLDSWHLLSFSLIREAFPEVPIVLIYRDPAAVLASQMREPGQAVIRSALGDLFDEIPFPGPSALEYRGRVVGRIFDAAARECENAHLVSYADLPIAVRTDIAPAFHLPVSDDAWEGMQSVASRDAKSPAFPFARPAESGAHLAGNRDLFAAAEAWAGQSYRRIEGQRGRS